MNHPAPLFLRFQILLISLFFAVSCVSTEPYYSDSALERAANETSYMNRDTLHTFLLIGDTGDPLLDEPDPVLSALQAQIQERPDITSVLFLGDNIYDSGMPADSMHKDRRLSEEKISVALSKLQGVDHTSLFLPGNHDWRYGQEGLIAQADFIENYSGINARMAPAYGCPGPFHSIIGDQWLLIAIDSDWLLKHGNRAETDISRCSSRTYDEVMSEIERVVNRHPEKHLLAATHHPLYSNGPHGGYFTLKDHIFPLTNLNSRYYLPLPVLGSVYPIYRKVGNSVQDIPNPLYQKYREDLLNATENARSRIFASGHEHSLSFFDQSDHLSIVSGSGSKITPVARGRGADFAYPANGFAKLISFSNGDYAIEFWVTSEEHKAGKRVFTKTFTPGENFSGSHAGSDTQEPVTVSARAPDSISTAAGPGYEAGPLKEAIWGSHYRDVWTTPVNAPVLHMNNYEILNIGGGQQSVSIVVQDSTGRKSIMRSIQKDPSEALPEILRETFARDIIQDQISASHPFGSLVAASLANEAGVYQTDPELGYIPPDSGLPLPGEDNGALVMVEEFVSVPWFRTETGKQASDILSTDAVWVQTKKNSHNRIDEAQLLRTRLFDMLIGDWDRHDGQWFWAEIETEGKTIYEPVPIDRDNAFFKSDGLIPGIASRKWALRKFQHFDNDIRDIKGINFNAQHFDRWFLTELNRDEWLRIANELQQSVTDEAIEHAVKQLPEAAYELSGEELAGKLKERRNRLHSFANRYYSVLASEISIFGSDRNDRFLIEQFENGNVRVRLSDGDSESNFDEHVLYDRTFLYGETDEIRIYGFDADDRYIFRGFDQNGIRMRLIPGEGTDSVEGLDSAGSEITNIIIYDTFNGLKTGTGHAAHTVFSNDRKVHRYNREQFQYNYTGPLLSGGFNPDDGVFLGGGVRLIRHGFRKSPYASLHEISAKHALLTSAFSFHLKNSITDAVGTLGLNIDLDILAPNYKANYFGLGNETEQEVNDNSFYRFRMDQVHLKTSLEKRISSITTLSFGPEYAYFQPSETADRFAGSNLSGLTDEDFEGHHFGALSSTFDINSTDNDIMPYYGFRFMTRASAYAGLNSKSESFLRIATEGTLYYTVERMRTTAGFRIGAETNIGDFNFFQANTLGGNSLLGEHGKLRGFLRDRFAGRTTFYHNFDLRTRIFDFQSYLFPATVGVLGFFDNGRVWLNSESSEKWHQGYGGGLWISPFRRAILTTTYSISEDDRIFSVNAGFTF